MSTLYILDGGATFRVGCTTRTCHEF